MVVDGSSRTGCPRQMVVGAIAKRVVRQETQSMNRNRTVQGTALLSALLITSIAPASINPSASAAKKKATTASKSKVAAGSTEVKPESEPRELRKINGVTYSVSRTDAAMLTALPEGQQRRELGSYTSPDGEIFSVYLKRFDSDSIPVPCSEGSNGYNCSIPPKDRVSTGGWSGTNGTITIMFAAPSDATVIVHTVNGDVAPVEIARLPEIGIAWYVHIGANMSPFGIESTAPGAKAFLPPFSPDRSDKLDPVKVYSEETPVPWAISEATFGPQRVLCLDTGDENSFDSCSPELRPGDKRVGFLTLGRTCQSLIADSSLRAKGS
jgi:hypothetical protein